MKKRDSLRDYLKEIGKIPLLTKEEELKLAKQIEQGDETAREKFIQANLRLVVSVAKGFWQSSSLDFFDLIQEGNIGLMIVVKRFDYRRKYKFSTYAFYWIFQAISRAVGNHSFIIRLPQEIIRLKKRIREVEEDYLSLHNRNPNDEELIEILGITANQIRRARFASTNNPLSLDKNIKEDALFLESIGDPKVVSGDEIWHFEANKKNLTKAMKDRLESEEEEILTLRYGLDGKGGRILKHVGDQFSVSREKIRQREKEAIEKLRKHFDKHPILRN